MLDSCIFNIFIQYGRWNILIINLGIFITIGQYYADKADITLIKCRSIKLFERQKLYLL